MFYNQVKNDKNKTIRSLMTDLDKYILIGALLVFTFFLTGIYIIQNQYLEHIEEKDNIEFISTLQIYTVDLITQISLIASSTTFLDYLRSGDISRNRLERDFYELMSRLPKHSFTGLTIKNKNEKKIFSTGEKTVNHILLPLCYVGDNFNSKFGRCIGNFTIYLDEPKVLADLIKLNSKINHCEQCKPLTSLPDVQNEIFQFDSSLSLNIEITSTDEIKYFYAVEFSALLVIFVIFLLLRTLILRVINHYIVEPIITLTSSVHDQDFNNSSLVEVLKIHERNEVLREKSIAEDKQNKWLANELHDELGSQIVLLKWSLQAIEDNNTSSNVAIAKENLNKLLVLVKNFIAKLRPEELETLGLSKALELMVMKWNDQNRMCRCKIQNLAKDDAISSVFSHAIYRICQESLTNIAKHSSATSATIQIHIESLTNQKRLLKLKIKDNGRGFKYSESFKPNGHGIDSMKERIISLGGVIQIISEPARGTEILIILPLTDE